MGMILRWCYASAFKFLHAYANFYNTLIILKFYVAIIHLFSSSTRELAEIQGWVTRLDTTKGRIDSPAASVAKHSKLALVVRFRKCFNKFH